MNSVTKRIASNAIVAAFYVALTLICYPISFGGIQFRFAEIMVLLCFFRRDYTVGLTLGCLIANLFSSIGILDAVFGTLATLASCLAICFCKHLAIAAIFPVVINGFVVGAELYFMMQDPFWLSTGEVALGEFAVLLVGYLLFLLVFKKRKRFYTIIDANRNIDFVW